MLLPEVLAELEAAGSAQTRKTYARHGMPEPMFGVSFAKLGEMKKRIKQNQALAEGLWATGILDARLLAAMVADPAMPPELLDAWAHDLQDHGLAGYVAELASRSPRPLEQVAAWTADPHEMVARAGWSLVAHLVMQDKRLSDDVFAEMLPRIEREIHGAKNREKEGMYNALLAIGSRSDALETLALASASRIGKVEIDHGDTSCKTPDAEPYIVKARAHQRAKAEKAAKPKAAKAAR